MLNWYCVIRVVFVAIKYIRITRSEVNPCLRRRSVKVMVSAGHRILAKAG